MDKEGVAVVIVTYRVDEDLERCLASLARQTHPPSQVELVINGDVDGAPRIERFKELLPLNITVHEENIGFAPPHGNALSRIKSPWVAVLNADAFAEADWIKEMLEATREGADVGMVAVAALMAHDPERIESMGLEAARSGMAYLRRWAELYREEPAHEVFGPSGVAALYRADMLKELGFYDPDFFIYYEDLDLAWRARWAGWRCVAAPRARVHHRGSAHLSLMDNKKTALLHRNKLITIVQNWPADVILRNFPYIIFWDTLALVRSLVRERRLTGIMSRLQFVARLPGAIRKRKILRDGAPGVERWLVDDLPRARARGLWVK